MKNLVLPDMVGRGSALAILVLCVLMATMHTALAATTAERSSLPPRTKTVLPLLVGSFLAVWLGLALVTADGIRFPIAGREAQFLTALLVGFGPMIVAIALLVSSQSMRALNAATKPEALILVQSYRMAGLIFLYPFLYYGIIPATFAIPAAIGDFLTGAAAPFVAHAIAKRQTSAIALAVAWNVFGIIDLLVAPATALASHSAIIAIYPLALVPLFLGPPLGILTHVFSLRNLGVRAGDDRSRPASIVLRNRIVHRAAPIPNNTRGPS